MRLATFSQAGSDRLGAFLTDGDLVDLRVAARLAGDDDHLVVADRREQSIEVAHLAVGHSGDDVTLLHPCIGGRTAG